MNEDANDTDQKNAVVSLKISPEDKSWVDDEQGRIRRAEGKKPTHANIFRRMRSAYSAHGTQSGQQLNSKDAGFKAQPLLLGDSLGSNLKPKQHTLFRELVVKVAEVIARGDSNLVAILARGIRWAHADLRPDRLKPEEPRASHAQAPKDGTRGGHSK